LSARYESGTHLTIDVREDGDRAVVRVAGELDAASLADFRTALPDKRSAPHLEFELEELTFIDAGGLGEFLRLTAEGRTVTLRRPQPLFRKVLDITGTGGLFELEPPS